MTTNFAQRNTAFLRRFGIDATLSRQADGSTERFCGVFSAPSRDARVTVSTGMTLAVSSAEPSLWIDTAVARPSDPAESRAWSGATPTQDDLVTLESLVYQVIDPRPDGQGGMKLVLQRQGA